MSARDDKYVLSGPLEMDEGYFESVNSITREAQRDRRNVEEAVKNKPPFW